MKNFQTLQSLLNSKFLYVVDEKGRRQKIPFHEPGIIETNDNKYCTKHNMSYTEYIHCLPTGRKYIQGCPKCEKEANEIEVRKALKAHMEALGLIFSTTEQKWINPISLSNNPENRSFNKR